MIRRQHLGGLTLGFLLPFVSPLWAQLRFEAEDISTPQEAWVQNRDSLTTWNLWSTDQNAQEKWSGGVVLRSPEVMADRATPEEGAAPLHSIIRDLPPGIYTVELKIGRVLGFSADGTTWRRYSGGPALNRVRITPGDVLEFWVDDRYAMEKEEARGPGYYDCVLVHAHGAVANGIPNQDFEQGDAGATPTDWQWWSREGTGSAQAVSDDVHGGLRALHITCDSDRDWACTNSARLAVVPGDELCLRAWLKGPKGGGDVNVAAVGYGKGERITWTAGNARASMNGTWVQATGYFTVPEEVDDLQIRIVGGGRTDIRVDDLSLKAEHFEWPSKPKVSGWAIERVRESLGRGAVALPRADGSVYLSWRLLESDPDGIGFDVWRRAGGDAPVQLNREPITRTCDFVDVTPAEGRAVYIVRPAQDDAGPAGDATWAQAGDGDPYVAIVLGDKDMVFQKVGVADLDGDGVYDVVIKQPEKNIDPWVKYWTRSPETYKLEAYLSTGQRLWQIDLGWGIERGIWYSPVIVFDLTGDGKAEVAAKYAEGDPRDEDGRVTSGEEFLVVWDGMTGNEIARAPWPERSRFSSYNYASRNQIAVAYLDGKTPCLLALRGTYTRMLVDAYQLHEGRLELLWQYDNEPYGGAYWGQGAHFTLAADLDADGRDEVILGSAVLDDNGVPMWSTGRGHPDAHYLSDIVPGNPGMELAYVMETPQRRGGGLNVVDAASGKTLWKLDANTNHVHGKGMCADIDAATPGWEVYGADADGHELTENRWLFAAQGDILRQGTDCPWGFGINTVYWDADLQKEIGGGRITDYHGEAVGGRIEGGQRLKADILGDWREEIITSTPGELRIYSTTIPAMDRRPCLMQDPPYRLATAMNAMGYTQDPTLSYDPVSRSPNLSLIFLGSRSEKPQIQIVVSTPPGVALEGRLELTAGPALVLTPNPVNIALEAGGTVTRTVDIAAAGKSRMEGLVTARLTAGSTLLTGQVPIRVAGGFLTEGIIVQAEDFNGQEKGDVKIRDDKAGVMGQAISHWDDVGHALSWEAHVQQVGVYHLVLRYCTPDRVARRLTIDGEDVGEITLPTTGGFGTIAAEWDHADATVKGTLLALALEPGKHVITLTNSDGKGCNLDYLALKLEVP